MSANGLRHFLDLTDIPKPVLTGMIDLGRAMKAARQRGLDKKPLAGKTLAMIFDKPSTRTRVSFDIAMRELGGETIMLTGAEMQLGRGETIADTARVLSRYVQCVMVRTNKEQKLLELAEFASIPVINGLTDRTHPCQLMADVMTFEEHIGPIEGKRVTWSGDGNNMATSWIHAAAQFDFQLRIACPEPLMPPKDVLDWAKNIDADVEIVTDPVKAAEGADCIVTDTWVSMGDEDTSDRHNMLRGFQVDERLMKQAKPGAIFMHCLPAHRGEEVTGSVIDGVQSVVWDEAENRLHAQQGILLWCFGLI